MAEGSGYRCAGGRCTRFAASAARPLPPCPVVAFLTPFTTGSQNIIYQEKEENPMRFLRLRWIYLSFSLVISAFLLIAIPGFGADPETLNRLEKIIQQQQAQI